MREYSFEKLEVWKLSRKLNVKVYLLSNKFPNSELFGLTSQLRRASISICSNIAEGSGRDGINEQRNFYNIAYGSLMEVLNQLMLCVDLGYLNEDYLNNGLRPIIEKISLALHKLKTKC